MAGQYSRCTEERIERFLQACRDGADQKTAAKFAGWGEKALYVYLKEHPDLRERMESAQSEVLVLAIKCWKDHFQKDWRACKEYLERRGGPEWKKPEEAPTVQEETEIYVEDLVGPDPELCERTS